MDLFKAFTGGLLSKSASGKLDLTDFYKVLRTGLWVGVAGILTTVIQSAGHYDLGALEPIIILVLTSVLESVNRLVKDNSVKE